MPLACSPDIIIETRGLRKSFKDITAVDNIDLAIRRGEFVALLGPNGAGKTTLVEMIEGIQKPDAGEIALLGGSWRTHERALRRRLGVCLQETRFIDKLTAHETLRLFASFYGLARDRVDEVIEQVGLADKQASYVVNLSGGQRQKLAIAVAILNRPEVLILDEPTIGLDPHSRREIWALLQDLKRQCTTLILTTHYMDEAAVLCERILIMNQGRVLAQGTLPELLAAYPQNETIEVTFAQAATDLDLAGLPGLTRSRWHEDRGRVRLEVADAVKALTVLLARCQEARLSISDLESRKPTLEDLFVFLTGRGLND